MAAATAHIDAVITGQVLRVRSLSSRLAFADVKLVGDEPGVGEVVELVVKERGLGARRGTPEARRANGGESRSRNHGEQFCPSRNDGGGETAACEIAGRDDVGVAHVPTALKRFNIGDVVRFHGQWESTTATKKSARLHKSFRCNANITVVQAWSRANRNAFSPVFTPLSASEMAFSSDDLCKFFTSSSSCPKGDRCQFKHSSDPMERRLWVQNRRAKKRERQTLKGDALDPHKKLSKGARGDVFAQFVVDTFGGAEMLGAGTGVLDVAGGRGDVYFELVHKQGITTTCVDPRREMRLSKKQRRWLKKNQGKSSRVSGDGVGGDKPEVSGGRGSSGGGNNTEGERRLKSNHLKTYFDDAFAETHANLLKNCSVILGMHPDEATEPIVDLAIQHSKPFAIVPCCVFPKSGEYMSFEGWVDYLAAKSSRIQRRHLNFQGKNLVLYMVADGAARTRR